MDQEHGFTLLELSIVLVIIGLIIGGITVGQDLIRSAELQRLTADINKYKVALNAFKLKYNQLPGDMKNATSYWPTECLDVGSNACDNAEILPSNFSGVSGSGGGNHSVLSENIPESRFPNAGWTSRNIDYIDLSRHCC